jgi:hypothetical protein
MRTPSVRVGRRDEITSKRTNQEQWLRNLWNALHAFLSIRLVLRRMGGAAGDRKRLGFAPARASVKQASLLRMARGPARHHADGYCVGCDRADQQHEDQPENGSARPQEQCHGSTSHPNQRCCSSKFGRFPSSFIDEARCHILRVTDSIYEFIKRQLRFSRALR